ncbi:MAG TPA: hypothetical protein VGR81_00695 [Candidatus Acidoferrales bacterium]|nr:hypothetical protein [Candidatus Acidoferrales bacterium]
MKEICLDGRVMFVSATDDRGVVGADTRLYFRQKGLRVFARYHGGYVRRGSLVGGISGSELAFRYTQVETSGQVHGGSSVCELQQGEDGRVRVLEHFTWRTRNGSGTNVFDELR